MLVMLDTNVVLSALLFPGETIYKMMHKVTTEHQLMLSSYIISEIHDVTQRKFPDKAEVINTLLSQIPYKLVETPDHIEDGHFEIRDAKDYPTLYSAIIANIDIFVTGDKDFDDVVVEKPKIVTPAEFVLTY